MFGRAILLTCLRLTVRIPLWAASSSWPEPCDVLLLGSSVSAGVGADGQNGWAQLLAAELVPQLSLVNEAIPGSSTWNAPLLLTAGLLRWRPRVIILSFTVGNDGLFFAVTDWQSTVCAEGFVRGLHRLVAQAQRGGAKVIVTSSYPQSRFKSMHVGQLRHVHERMATLRCDRFIDFLTPMDDGQGRWREEEQADPAHPNSKGHRIMLESARQVVRRVLDSIEE